MEVWEGEQPIPRDRLLEKVGEIDGLLCILSNRIDRKLLERAARLKVVSQMAVGLDNIDLPACTTHGIKVGHTPDVLTETTADTAWALLAASVRRLPEGQQAVKDGGWGSWDPRWLLGGDLQQTTLGIVGLGRIGTAVARRAQGFQMRVLYTGPNRKPDQERELGVQYCPLVKLLRQSDHVILAAPLTTHTRHLIDRETLGMMRNKATLVNVSRGGLVDQEALWEALTKNQIARAALDVTDPEPLPPDHPLLQLDNCLVIPHLGSASLRTRAAMARLAVDNLVQGLSGRAMTAPAN